ncbi:MAG: pyridoxal phosphate-dependent aminotransferase [Candidatus Tumulicola sp.]
MNPRVLEIPGSLIRKVAARKRPTSIDLGLGEPTLLPTRAHFDSAMRYVADHGVKYTANAGDGALRDAIARHYRYPGLEKGGNVCVTAGSQEAMYVSLMTLLDPSCDELLVVEPAFPSYVKMAALNGVACRTVTMREDDDFAFDADRILAGVGGATRAIVLCSPCNPTGRVLSCDQADLLARGLEQRGGDIWLIHDEIYREQTFTADAAHLAQCYPQTIVTNSVSKSNALTGLRLGWILAPERFVKHAVKAHAWVTSCTDTFAQHVALHVFSSAGGVGEHSAWYADQRRAVLAALAEHGVRFVPVDGAFYACVRLPDGVNSLAAAGDLIDDYDVVTIPGIAFGAALEGWLRLSWVAPIADFREGLSRIAKFMSS